jgi:PleD family two-component response regulator
MHSILLVSNGDLKFISYNVLLSRDYNVVVASSGEQALYLIDDGFRTDLIVLSIMTQHTDGYEILKRLRTRRHAMHIPVILVSETGFDVFKLNTFKIGAVSYLTRSQSYYDFIGMVNKIMKNNNFDSNKIDSLIRCTVSFKYPYEYFLTEPHSIIRLH